nr:integrase, catalytic region, zinc finger, CCHC-type, peptidase aspartic, catalytic [Tanacetum cinerariifolium]
MGLPEDIYATVDSCDTGQEIWLRVQQMIKGSDIGVQEKKAKLFNEWEMFTSTDGESIKSYYHRFSNQMHNNIMAANSRDRPPMLATKRYAQWQLRFLRYIDTRPNGDALRKCILEEKEAIHLLLTKIGEEIYSTVDACKTTHDMWIAIERLQQEWSRFVTIVKKHHDLETISYHKLFDVLKQHQKEVNEIHAERIAKNANPLALAAAAQQYPYPYYQAPKYHKSYAPPSKQSSSTISNESIKYKGKDIVKPITPPSENKNVDTSLRYKNEHQTGQFGNQRTVTVVGARETICSQVVQQTGIQCFNCKEFAHFAKECRKPKRVKDYTYHKEKMLLCKQAEKGIPLHAEQADWLEDMDEEINEQELEAHYGFMAKIQEVPNADSGTDTEPLEQNELEKYKTLNDRTVDYDKLELVKEKHDALVKQSLLTKLHFEGLFKEKTKVITDLKQKEEKDLDKLIAMEKIPKPSVLGKPTTFSNSLKRKHFSKTKSVTKTNMLKGLSKSVTTQNLHQTARQAVRNTNVIRPGMYRIDTRPLQNRAPQLPQTYRNTDPCMSTSTGVIHKTNVSRPPLRSTQMKDKILPNNSQVKLKKTEVEDHHRISSIFNNIKFVTACNDNLKSRTLNVKAVCAICGKCLVDSDHFACVTKILNDVNARTKKLTVVPVSNRKPKSQTNKSVAIPPGEQLHQNPLSKILRVTIGCFMRKLIVQLIIFIVDSGCTKHMTGNLKLLCNFIEKYLGTVCFGNDQISLILGYGDLVQGNITINRVYYVEGLNHNLFLVGQFCDADLEVAF